jgi:chemotaxis protein MotB
MNASESNEGKSTFLPWGVAVVATILSILLVFRGMLPAQKLAEECDNEVSRLEGELKAVRQSAESQSKQIDDLLADKQGLSQEATVTKVRLEQALAEKAEALAELEKAKKEISEALGTQIKSGDVLIKEVNGELVVDVADKLLFDTGQTELNEAGQELLAEVSKSMKRLPKSQVFRVGGHTDSQRVVSKELIERYPTNWELAAARATNVVRHLQEKGGVPGRQLIAAAFSQYQPASTNKTEKGRQKNRRIEIVLLRKNRR